MTATPAHRTVRSAAFAAAVIVALSGCAPEKADENPAKKQTGQQAGGSQAQLPGASRSQWVLSNIPLRVDLLSLDKTSAKAVTLRLRFTNFGTDKVQVSQFTKLGLGIWESNGTHGAAGLTLVDPVGRKEYYPLFEKGGECLCTLEDVLGAYLNPHETFEYFASFPVPPNSKLMVLVPNTPPFLNVPVADRPGPVTPPPEQELRDPAKVTLAPPKIKPLADDAEATDGSGEQTEDDKKVEVRLSADVLFALNSAKLSPKAKSVLQRVATRINASKATAVTIDGYTDDSGNDQINVPLSKRRAKAVQRALKPLVAKAGIGFKSEGHGSADPVAPNTTDENRKRNRRVTIGFAR